MQFTQITYNGVNKKCNEIWGIAELTYVSDGTIFAQTPNGDGTFDIYNINKTCCNILKNRLIAAGETTLNGSSPENIYFDLDEQKCKWSNINNEDPCSLENKPIKIVLNPKGNDGAFFTLTEDDTCNLKVSFKYLFKINCESLTNTIGLPSNENLNLLLEEKAKLETNLSELSNEAQYITTQNSNSYYSLECLKYPVKDETNELPNLKLTEVQKLPFSNTGFGSLTNEPITTVPKIPIYLTKPINFCVTEEGLVEFKKIIGPINYINFINGDPKSYTCDDVLKLDELNQQMILNNKPILMFVCSTPFGFKTDLNNKLTELTLLINELIINIEKIDTQIKSLDSLGVSSCDTILGNFENISANVSIDIINDDNSVTQWFTQTLFTQIGLGNLYNYLVNNIDNSGFFVCGQPDNTETWASGCTGLLYPEFTGGTPLTNVSPTELNVSICDLIKNELYNELYNESGLSNIGDFNGSLSPNSFSSNWLTYETIISGTPINDIVNKRIKLNVLINSSCGNFCLLIDQINLIKECNDIDRANIFISQSPGFNLTKIIDNKKSWIETNKLHQRDFNIANSNGLDKIRQTEYQLDEERLVLNSKEIELTMNMASAVENDVWCYLLDNPNLLSGNTCDSLTAFTPTDIFGNKIFLPTGQTNVNCIDILTPATDFYTTCKESFLSGGSTTMCLPELDCVSCGKTLKISVSETSSLWITCTPNNALGFYHITDIYDTQSNIYNVTESFTGFSFTNLSGICISTLTDFIETINDDINDLNLENPPYEIFWEPTTCNCDLNCGCGDVDIDISGLTTSNILETTILEMFQDIMISELTDVKNRKILSSYPTRKAVYDRYLNATSYGLLPSNGFDYYKMDKFTGLVNNYWDDLIEQIIPATTLWGSIKVYTNTLFDQQKFKYRSYSTLSPDSLINNITPPSPINGSLGLCEDVELNIENVEVFSAQIQPNAQTYTSVCLSQMNWGSEFIGTVNILDGENVVDNEGIE